MFMMFFQESEDRDRWKVLVKVVMNLRFCKMWGVP
jgi:hypothetical protein